MDIDVVVVLVRTEGALNLGSVARLCDNFGCALRLVDVQARVDDEGAVMMAYPSDGLLREAPCFPSLQDAVADAACVVGTSSKLVAARDAAPLDTRWLRTLRQELDGPLALVFGNERLGLTKSEAEQCHHLVRLCTPGPRESMNLSHAVAATLQVVALSTLEEAESPLPSNAGLRAGPQRREALLTTWLSALEGGGYFRSQTRQGFAPRLRGLLGRMQLDLEDTALLEGMLRVLGRREDG